MEMTADTIRFENDVDDGHHGKGNNSSLPAMAMYWPFDGAAF